ncbi:type II 3-dehydroquinate dehydratase [bacterium]|nr:type II 3-dehydroquinate dehydratase [bacterium]
MTHHDPIIWVLNGPNLQALGRRLPDVYGNKTLSELTADWMAYGTALGVTVRAEQSNHEGQLIDWIHEARGSRGIILNAGAFTHYSVAIRDAVESIRPTPVVEVHLSNVHAREAFRSHSVLSAVCVGQITGFGDAVYPLAMRVLMGQW